MRNLMLMLLCVAIGCSRIAPSTNQTGQDVATNDAAGPQIAVVQGATPDEQQQAKMLAAKDALFEKLSGRLMQAMAEGVSSGRTGVRLRNPNNQAPQWAAELIEQQTDQPTFVTLSDHKAAAILPIKLQVQCLMCHGPDEQIAPDVQAQLQKSYPADQATGFHEGDLRGWFWITLDQVD